MRDAAVMENPCALEFVPDHFKIQEMCHDAFMEDTSSLQYFPDWFVTQQEVKSWHDYYVIVMITMNLLSGTKVIKEGRSRKHKLKKS